MTTEISNLQYVLLHTTKFCIMHEEDGIYIVDVEVDDYYSFQCPFNVDATDHELERIAEELKYYISTAIILRERL